jgi:flagellar hook assembly protein FlgD
VYTARGALVTTLVDEEMPSGRATVVWDGRDARGRTVASGAYFCRLEAGPSVQTRKMLLLK